MCVYAKILNYSYISFMKRLLTIITLFITFASCSKDEAKPELSNSAKLEGKEYITSFNTIYNRSVEFYKQGEIRVVYKYKNYNQIGDLAQYSYYKWMNTGDIGVNIEVTIPADDNFPERIVKGVVTDGILTFDDQPLKGVYTLLKK